MHTDFFSFLCSLQLSKFLKNIYGLMALVALN